MRITRRLEFDAGHRIPNHKSQCKHLHGHRYAIEITLIGDIINTEGESSQGMVMDFSDVKQIAKSKIVDPWDHAFLVYQHDTAVCDFLKTIPDHKTVILDVVPTAENLARVAFDILDPAYHGIYHQHLKLQQVRLYETPNNWADAVRQDPDWS